MGLTTWKNAPDGRILKSDSYVAKNYLTEQQIRQLERGVSAYFDYIEGLIERENTFTMRSCLSTVMTYSRTRVMCRRRKREKKLVRNTIFSTGRRR